MDDHIFYPNGCYSSTSIRLKWKLVQMTSPQTRRVVRSGLLRALPFFRAPEQVLQCSGAQVLNLSKCYALPAFLLFRCSTTTSALVWPGFQTDWATWQSGTWHLASQRQKSHRNPLVNRTLALVGEEANCSWCSCCFSFFFQTAHTKFLFSCCQSNLFLWPLNRVAIPHVMMKPRPPCAKRGTGSMGKIRSKVQTTFFVCTCKRWLADVFRALQELLMLSHVTLSLSRTSECWAN